MDRILECNKITKIVKEKYKNRDIKLLNSVVTKQLLEQALPDSQFVVLIVDHHRLALTLDEVFERIGLMQGAAIMLCLQFRGLACICLFAN